MTVRFRISGGCHATPDAARCLTFTFLLAVGVTSSFAQTFVKGLVLELEKKPVEVASITFEAQFHVDADLTLPTPAGRP